MTERQQYFRDVRGNLKPAKGGIVHPTGDGTVEDGRGNDPGVAQIAPPPDNSSQVETVTPPMSEVEKRMHELMKKLDAQGKSAVGAAAQGNTEQQQQSQASGQGESGQPQSGQTSESSGQGEESSDASQGDGQGQGENSEQGDGDGQGQGENDSAEGEGQGEGQEQQQQSEPSASEEGDGEGQSEEKQEQQAAQDPHDIVGQRKNIKVLEYAIKHNLTALLVGKTGTAKTSTLNMLAHRHGKTLWRVSANGQLDIDDFVGCKDIRPVPGGGIETAWIDAVLVWAMRNGDWIVLEEVNMALPEILAVTHAVLDDNKSLLLTKNNREMVHAHPDFRFFATMNPNADYAGTKELNQAFLSRFNVVVEFEYLPPKQEAKLLVGRCNVDEPTATMMVECAKQARSMQNKGDLYYTFSTRDLLSWALLVEPLGMSDAFEVAILNRANEEERPDLKNIFKAVTNLTLAIDNQTATVGTFIDEFKEALKSGGGLSSREVEAAKAAAESLKLRYEAKLAELEQRESAAVMRVQQVQDEAEAKMRTELEARLKEVQSKLFDGLRSSIIGE